MDETSLFKQICGFQNLWAAAMKAQKGKRSRPDVCGFHFKLEHNLHEIREELLSGTYSPGEYKTFTITIPKKRMISAAPYRDRVVHHAVCNLVFPLIEQRMLPCTFANRKGLGTHKAIFAYQKLCRKHPYVLKCDIRKFFPSIDHDILLQQLQELIPCTKTMGLIKAIIHNSNPQEPVHEYYPGDDLFSSHLRRKGLPIGNLTSQYFGNLYLTELDDFVIHTLQAPGYVRYVDDFVLLGPNAAVLRAWKQRIAGFLTSLRLSLHPRKSQIHRTKNGVPFLGQLVFRKYRRIGAANVRRFKVRLRGQLDALSKGKCTEADIIASLNSWTGHAGHAATLALRERLFHYLCGKGFSPEKLRVLRGGSWNNNTENCRVSNRNNNEPENRNNNIGFRLASV